MRLIRPPRRPALATLLAIAPAPVGAGLLVRGAARALSGPLPSGPVTMSVSTPTSGLTDGSAVTFSVSSTGAAVLSGGVTAHICATGQNISNSFNFGYQGSLCVKQAGITSGVLTGGDYATTMNFSGVTTSGDLTFHAGTGTVSWIDDLSGFNTLICDSSNPCDLVVQVRLQPRAQRLVLHAAIDLRRRSHDDHDSGQHDDHDSRQHDDNDFGHDDHDDAEHDHHDDAGHDHHDDAGHNHDHDAGHNHDHDAGPQQHHDDDRRSARCHHDNDRSVRRLLRFGRQPVGDNGGVDRQHPSLHRCGLA